MIEDRGNLGLGDLASGGRRDRRPRATTRPACEGLFTSFRANTPWLYLDIDRDAGQDRWACRSSDVFNTLQVYLGSLYVNDFNHFGRTWQVNVQADAALPHAASRTSSSSRSATPRARWCRWARWPASATISGPVMIMRYNMYPAAADQRQRRPRASAPARRSTLMETVGRRRAAAGDAARVDRAGPAAAPGRQHGHVRLRCWPWCWCSWCWPPSTKAGRCRWP